MKQADEATTASVMALSLLSIVVGIADRTSGTIIATGTLLVELKFYRGCGCVGHIEDVVVDAAYRGAGLGLRCALSHLRKCITASVEPSECLLRLAESQQSFC